jgi:hypothetical protein
MVNPQKGSNNMAAINRKLTRKQWEELEPKCVDAALQSTLAATKWAEIAAEAVVDASSSDEKERKARKSETDKIAEWPLDKTDKLVAMIEEYNGAFRKAIKRHEIAGREFDANATGMATHTTSLLHKTLRKLKLTGSDAEAA